LGAKIVQAERNGKQKTKFFACISEAPPIFAAGKVVQAERNGKQKTKFFCLHFRGAAYLRQFEMGMRKWE